MMKQTLKIISMALLCATTLHAELIGYWTFDDDTCADYSGNGYYGTMNGGSYSVDVPSALAGGKSIDLTGGDHYVIIDSIAAGAPDDPFNFDRSMTVSVWVKGWPDGNWEPFVSKRGETTPDDGQAGWQVRRYGDTQQLGFTLRKEDLGESTARNLQGQTTSVTDGNWHHVAMTYNGYRQRIYVDGVLDRVYRTLGSIVPAAERVVFGAREYVERNPSVQLHSRVKLDDIAIYNNVLTETQIKYIAQGGDPALADQIVHPIAYWSFDDESVNDHSGCNRHGTIYNGATYSTDVASILGGGKSLNLYGTNNYVLIDSVAFGDLADPFSLGQEITVSAWVKGWSKEFDWAPVLAAKHGENLWGWQVRRRGSTADTLCWTTRGVTNVAADLVGKTENLKDGQWHHVVCTYDGQYKMIYVDGLTDQRQYALEEVRDDCSEQVILGARNNGNKPQTFADVQLDEIAIFGQALTPQQVYALSRGVSPTNLPASSVESPLIYNFEDLTMQGWRNVLVSRLMCPGNDGIDVNHLKEYGSWLHWNVEIGNYKLEMMPAHSSDDYDPRSNSDRRHATLLVRSPQFVLNGSGDLSMWLIGGKGGENVYANESDNIALTHNTYGTMRAYLRRARDGAYLFNLRQPASGAFNYLSVSDAQLAAYFGETCTVDLINACDGSWGWIGADEVIIPGTLLPEPECGAIQFDMCQHHGTYLGTDSPGHAMKKIEDGANWWNGSGIDQADGQFFQANGADASGITIDFGTTVNDAGGVNIDWDSEPIGAFVKTGSGVYNNFLMRDWVCSTNNNDLAVRIKGFTNGLYRVYAMVRDPSAMNATYNVYMGLNLESRADATAVLRGVSATTSVDWKAGGNFVYCNLEVESEDDYITVIVDPTADTQGVLQGLQIVNITDTYIGSTIMIVR